MSHQPHIDIEATVAPIEQATHSSAPITPDVSPVPAHVGGLLRHFGEHRVVRVGSALAGLAAVALLSSCGKAPNTVSAEPTVGISSTETPGTSPSGTTDTSSETGTTGESSPSTGETTGSTGTGSETTDGSSSASTSETSSPSESTSSSESASDTLYAGLPLSAFESLVVPKSEVADAFKKYPGLEDTLRGIDAEIDIKANELMTKDKMAAFHANHAAEQKLEKKTGDLNTFPSMPNPGDTIPDPATLAASMIDYEKMTVDQLSTSMTVDPSGELTQRLINTLYLDPDLQEKMMQHTQADVAKNLQTYTSLETINVLKVETRKVDGKSYVFLVSIDHGPGETPEYELTLRTVEAVPAPYDIPKETVSGKDIAFPILNRYFADAR